ncbi:MAG: hypothetical protein ABIQ43_00335 [Sphingomonas sp.]
MTVTPGTGFVARMSYNGPNDAVYTRTTPDGTTNYVVDLAGATQIDDKGRQPLSPGMRAWVLGHQFHAQMRFFDELVGGSTVRDARAPDCDCEERVGRIAAPDMGIESLSLIVDRRSRQVRKFLVRRAGDEPIVSIPSDWRRVGGRLIPFRIVLNDGKRVFDFRFDRVTVRD